MKKEKGGGDRVKERGRERDKRRWLKEDREGRGGGEEKVGKSN